MGLRALATGLLAGNALVVSRCQRLLGAEERFEFGLDVLVTGLAAYGRGR